MLPSLDWSLIIYIRATYKAYVRWMPLIISNKQYNPVKRVTNSSCWIKGESCFEKNEMKDFLSDRLVFADEPKYSSR